MPKGMDLERLILYALVEGKDSIAVLRSVPINIRRLFVRAYQSYIFNKCLSIGGDGSGARTHVSELQRAVGATGQLHRPAHGRRCDEDAADFVRLDPRVRIAPASLATLNTLSTGLYWEAVAAHRAFNDARALAATLATRSGATVDAITGELEALAPTGLQRTCACSAGEAPGRRRRRWKR